MSMKDRLVLTFGRGKELKRVTMYFKTPEEKQLLEQLKKKARALKISTARFVNLYIHIFEPLIDLEWQQAEEYDALKKKIMANPRKYRNKKLTQIHFLESLPDAQIKRLLSEPIEREEIDALLFKNCKDN